jgi:hypothetical protein
MIKEYCPVSHNKNKRDVEGSESCGKFGSRESRAGLVSLAATLVSHI